MKHRSSTQSALRALVMAACAALAAISAPCALAQEFPTKPIHIISPFPAGGFTGILSRAIGERLKAAWGQPVIVEGRPGAGGNVATTAVANSPADGHTLMLATANFTIAPSIYTNLPFDRNKPLTPVIQAMSVSNVFLVRPGLQVNSLGELIAMARSQPGKLNYASPGNGSYPHLVVELFKKETGIHMVHIPYAGGAQALPAILGGQVDLYSSNLGDVIGHIKSGGLRPLAVTGPQRSPLLPGVPTIAEAGVPGFEADGWMGFFAPPNTPKAIVDKLNAQMGEALRSEEMRNWLRQQGFEVIANTPEQFSAYLKQDAARWAQAVKYANVKAD